MRAKLLFGSLVLLLLACLPANAATFRWTSQGDILTLDPHAQTKDSPLR